MSNYPPIPPNCLMEFDESGGGCFVFNNLGDRSWCFNAKDDDRKIIASYMRCAWLDEAEQRLAAWQAETEDYSAALLPANVIEARKNAEAWAAWGKELQ